MDEQDDIILTITAEQLEAEMLRREYAVLLERSEVYPSATNWACIIEHKMEGIGELLYRKYLVSYILPEEKRSEYHVSALNYFPDYLNAVSRPYAVKVVYSDIASSPTATTYLISSHRLFDAVALRRCLSAGATSFVIDQLQSFQPRYSREDLQQMRSLYMALLNLPEQGAIREKRVVFSTEQRYICPEGHSNNVSDEYCRTCGKNIQGLTERQMSEINAFGNKLDALEDLLVR